MRCKKCGVQLPDGYNYCHNCGYPTQSKGRIKRAIWKVIVVLGSIDIIVAILGLIAGLIIKFMG